MRVGFDAKAAERRLDLLALRFHADPEADVAAAMVLAERPAQLPEVVFRQLDNLICTGLGHSADLRTIARSALSDDDTLQSLAVGLDPRDAMIVGRVTGGFPIAVRVLPLPASGHRFVSPANSGWRFVTSPSPLARKR